MAKRSKKDTVQDAPTEQLNEGATLASETKRTNNTMSENSIIEFSEDLSNAEAPSPLPVGDYPFEIRAAERKSAASGSEFAVFTLFVAPEQYPADYTDGDPDGTTFTFWGFRISDDVKGRYRARKFTEAVGGKLGKKLDLNEFIGLSGVASIVHEDYEGEKNAKVKRIVAP